MVLSELSAYCDFGFEAVDVVAGVHFLFGFEAESGEIEIVVIACIEDDRLSLAGRKDLELKIRWVGTLHVLDRTKDGMFGTCSRLDRMFGRSLNGDNFHIAGS